MRHRLRAAIDRIRQLERELASVHPDLSAVQRRQARRAGQPFAIAA
jgi:hypothetical protein